MPPWGVVTGAGDVRYFEPHALVHVVKLDNGANIFVPRHLLTDLGAVPDRRGKRAAFSAVVGRA